MLFYSWSTTAFSALEAEGLACFHIFTSNVGKREGDSETLEIAIKSYILMELNGAGEKWS